MNDMPLNLRRRPVSQSVGSGAAPNVTDDSELQAFAEERDRRMNSSHGDEALLHFSADMTFEEIGAQLHKLREEARRGNIR